MTSVLGREESRRGDRMKQTMKRSTHDSDRDALRPCAARATVELSVLGQARLHESELAARAR
ncbi:MAG: hypothetical protein BGO98_10285 [Myxococcales bacterium 68-20]|nr:MAG: hypothetical protein BGO98_10285 [Myxococcales bacterium 68-20]